jgi:hypothetical protein
VIAAVTVVADNPEHLTGQPVMLTATVAVAVAAVLGWGFANRRATALAAVALVVVVSWIPVSDMVNWASYRIRLQQTHQHMAKVINSTPFQGTVAIGDAGILPFLIQQPAIDLGGLADPAIAHRRFDAAYLRQRHVAMVIAGSSSPAAGSQWVDGLGTQVAYAYMQDKGFASSGGPPMASRYWLNYWVDPAANSPELVARLNNMAAIARKENLQPDSQVLVRHFFDFPFLSTGNS